VAEGTVLWCEGDKPAQAFVLVEGRLEAIDEAGERQEADVPGCMLGEFGLITGEHRQNSVTALTPCTLYELSRAQWERMQEAEPRLAFVLTSVALKYAGNRLRQVAFSAHQSSAVPV
jgi:CRP/FNR family cyclic AMP-dependent transcriptional regulator